MLLLPIGLLGPQASGGSQMTAALLLDGMPGLLCAVATFKLRSAYAGACLRVRRSSDNAEQDIGFNGALLDTTALTGFCGAADGFLSKAYDQSGGAADMAQTVAASQPRIVAAGVVETFVAGKPGIRFLGAQSLRNGINPAGNLSVLTAASRTSAASTGQQVDVVASTSSGAAGWMLNLGNAYGPASDAAKARFYGDYGNDPAAAWLNGVKQGGTNPFDAGTGAGQGAGVGATVAGVSAGSGLCIGQESGNGAALLTGMVGAVAVVSGILSDAQMAQLTTSLQGQVS